MVPVLLILIPLLSGLLLFAVRNGQTAKQLALFSTILTLAVTFLGVTYWGNQLAFNTSWLTSLNSRFHVHIDGMGKILTLLTAISFPIILVATQHNRYEDENRFYGLLLLAQAGLMGVFVAYDALLFYFFWELALIPVYFLCSRWGGEKRIAVTFKFFIYTFIGSLLMLVALIYLYFQAGQSFDITAFYALKLQHDQEYWIFWLLFIAFAIKMPIFPFHTWQPDTYEQSPTAVTMVLSGIMVKMGVFAVIRWLAPVVPYAFWNYGDNVVILAIIGMIYASLVAIQQDDMKRLVAYSSIAHIGLMVVAIWASNTSGMQGVMIQMFNHGLNIIGLWIVINVIEQQYGTRKMSELGGIAQKPPSLVILLVVVALANVALPLTNAFVGEFMMFNGVFASTASKYSLVYAIAAGITIILSAVYTLNMIQKVFYGNANAVTEKGVDISLPVTIALSVIVVAIILMGVYPKPMLDTTSGLVDAILKKINGKTLVGGTQNHMNAIIISAIWGLVMMYSGVVLKKSASVRPLAIAGLILLLIGNICEMYGMQMVPINTGGMLRFDRFTLLFNTIAFFATLVYFLLSAKDIEAVGAYKSEYFALIFFILAGVAIVTSFNTLLMLFLGIEIISIPLYILTGSDKRNLKSNEASLKYFLLGSFSTGIMLMGITLIYGARGSFAIDGMTIAVVKGFDKYLIAGLLLLFISMSFKVSAAPFHFWTPDVYDGAPTVFTAFMATIVKAAVFIGFMRLFDGSFGQMLPQWKLTIAIIIVLTLFIGNITAVFQQSVKRMLAYSSIAQAGFMMFALFSYNDLAKEGLMLYTAAYSLATIGIFAVLLKMKDYTFEGFNGLAKREPVLAATNTIFLLSLAGIPLTAGFFAKYFMLASAIKTGTYLWLVVFAVLMAAISVYYYFRVIQAMYFKQSNEDEIIISPVTPVFKWILIALAGLIILLGLFPQILLSYIYF